MKATDLPYGKFQTAVFKLAQELGNDGSEAISRLDTDEHFRKRVATHMLAGAPSQVYVTMDAHKNAFRKAVEKLEETKGLTPYQVAEAVHARSGEPPHNIKFFWNRYRSGREWGHFSHDEYGIAEVLGTTVEYLKSIGERFEEPVKVELDPRADVKALLAEVPEGIENVGQFLLWLSKAIAGDISWQEIATAP
jgi:hypothetical protein